MNASTIVDRPQPRCTAGELLALLKPRKRTHTRVSLWLERDTLAPSWVRDRAIAILRVTYERWDSRDRDRNGPEMRAEISTLGWIKAGYADAVEEVPRHGDFGPYTRWSKAETNIFAPTKGHWFWLGGDRFLSPLRLLPRDARITFLVRLDKYDQGPLPEHGIHCDELTMEAEYKRGKAERRTEFLIESSTGPHNTARFGVWS